MKLRNKKTGEIIENVKIIKLVEMTTDKIIGINGIFVDKDGFTEGKVYDSLEDFNKNWEEYEESDDFYYIDRDGGIVKTQKSIVSRNSKMYNYEIAKSIGNFFTTKEEAEKAVERLKALKRLKDKGFRFKSWHGNTGEYSAVVVYADVDNLEEGTREDLDLLCGGEE